MTVSKKFLSILLVAVLMSCFLTPAVAADGKVNINTAGVAELMTLYRVSTTIAERIIEYRTTVAPFETPEDVMKVSGFTKKHFYANEARIVVTDP